MSALAASWRVAAVIPGPSSRATEESDSGLRLLLMDASRPALESLGHGLANMSRADDSDCHKCYLQTVVASGMTRLHARLDRLCAVEQLLFPLKARPDVA